MTSTWAGAETPMVSSWVATQLTLQATALDLIDPTLDPPLSQRIYEDVAPPGIPYPFIVFQCQSPPRDVRGVGVSRVMVDTLYLVKAVSQASSYVPLAPIAKVIDAAMTSSQGSAVGDGLVLSSVRTEQFRMVTIEDGTQFRHLGGEYQIHAQATQ